MSSKGKGDNPFDEHDDNRPSNRPSIGGSDDGGASIGGDDDNNYEEGGSFGANPKVQHTPSFLAKKAATMGKTAERIGGNIYGRLPNADNKQKYATNKPNTTKEVMGNLTRGTNTTGGSSGKMKKGKKT